MEEVIKYQSRLFKADPSEFSEGGGTLSINIRRFFRAIRGYTIYGLKLNGEIIATAYIKRNYLHKYAFLGKKDSIINPYQTKSAYRNRGYAKQLLKEVIKDNGEWEHLYAVVRCDNLPSIKCLESIGMKNVGYAKKQLWSYYLSKDKTQLLVFKY